MTEQEYWGTLKGWGFSNPRRLTPRTFSMLNRDADPCHIPDPAPLSHEEREAALHIVKKLHVSLDS
ncbi:MAG TPA: hypothetical protein VF662_12755 [Allosphingosinicella sp.]|jgi:hypothetical protein